MSEDVLAKIVEQMPIVGAIMLSGWVFLKYLDRWIERVGQAQQSQAQHRQQEIIVLLERTLAATQQLEANLAAVVERNTRALDASTAALVHVGEALAQLLQAQADTTTRLIGVERSMREHEKDVAARPCQQMRPITKKKEG